MHLSNSINFKLNLDKILNDFRLNFKGELAGKRRVGRKRQLIDMSQVGKDDQVGRDKQ